MDMRAMQKSGLKYLIVMQKTRWTLEPFKLDTRTIASCFCHNYPVHMHGLGGVQRSAGLPHHNQFFDVMIKKCDGDW